MHIEGLIAAPFTPLKPDGSIHPEAICSYAELLAGNGVEGVFICGTTGEGMSLTLKERMQVAEAWSRQSRCGLKLIVHIGDTSLQTSKSLMLHAEEIGAYAVGMIGPCHFKPETVDVLVEYCRDVAAVSPKMPFYYYHMPSINGIDFSMRTFLEKAADTIPNLAGIKYTYEDLMDFHLCQALEGGRFDMLFGRDELLLCGLALGAKGAVGSTYNFAAPLYTRLMDEFHLGRLEKARALQRQSMEMIKIILSGSSSFLPAAKALMKQVGIDCGPVRLPLTNLTEARYRSMISRLEEAGFSTFCNRPGKIDAKKTKGPHLMEKLKSELFLKDLK